MNDSLTISLEQLQAAIHDSLAAWGDLGSSDEELLGFLLLVQQERASIGTERGPLDLRQATNQVLQRAIDQLAQQEQKEAAVLQARFVEGEITRQVANRLYASPDQVNRWQRAAISNLSKLVLGQETVLRQRRLKRLEDELPARSYSRLFGLDEVSGTVVKQLLKPEAPWIATITGIGGIGKTSLADALTRRVIQSLAFDEVIWLQAGSYSLSGMALPPEQGYEQLLTTLTQRLWPGRSVAGPATERVARVRQALKARPYLVVIDNLETEASTVYLLEQIREMTEPTKFLLATRARPTLTPATFIVSLDELPWQDASALFRHHAETLGLNELAQAQEPDVRAVYDVVGGNPLALKLVGSLAGVLSLPRILADLQRSQPGPIEDLYRNIYWEAWRTLSDDAQTLLQSMPLVAESGALPAQMRAISDLPEAGFWQAVTELISRSLLEVRGTYQERRYGIHRLTETFVRTEIIDWPEE